MPLLEVKWVVDTFGIRSLPEINPEQYGTIVLVDTSTLTTIDKRITPSQVVEIIDHRMIHDTSAFKNARVLIEIVGAAATLVAERFQKEKITPSNEAAILLHTAIISNTLNFKERRKHNQYVNVLLLFCFC